MPIWLSEVMASISLILSAKYLQGRLLNHLLLVLVSHQEYLIPFMHSKMRLHTIAIELYFATVTKILTTKAPK